MEELFKAVASIGFPAAIAIYLLVRFEGKIDGLEKAINNKDGVLDKLDNLARIITDMVNRK